MLKKIIIIYLLAHPVSYAGMYVWVDGNQKHVSTADPQCIKDNGRGGKYVDTICSPPITWASSAPAQRSDTPEIEDDEPKKNGLVASLEKKLKEAEKAVSEKRKSASRYKRLNKGNSTRGVADITELNELKIKELSEKAREIRSELNQAMAAAAQ